MEKADLDRLENAVEAYGPASLTAILMALGMVHPVFMVPRLFMMFTDAVEMKHRVQAMEAQYDELKTHSASLQRQVVQLQAAVLELRQARQEGREAEIDYEQLGLMGSDVKRAISAYMDALAADTDQLAQLLVTASGNALLGEIRSQAELAALRLFPYLTAETIAWIHQTDPSREYVTYRGLDRRHTDPLEALGLIDVHSPPEAPRIAGTRMIRLTTVGRALHRLTTAPE